jgi:hypothetical protein
MAVQQQAESEGEAKARLAHYVDELEAVVRARYPDAGFHLGRGPEPGTWLLWTRIPVEDDLELEEKLAERSTDLLVEHGIAISVVAVPGPTA